MYAAPHTKSGRRRYSAPYVQERVMKTFEAATSLLIGVAAQAIAIGLVLVG
jgi:hypothetical protein